MKTQILLMTIATAAVVLIGVGDAFTNGTILPGYLCNPGHGLPTSLGGVLQILNKTGPGVSMAIANIHHQKSLIAQNNLIHVSFGFYQETISKSFFLNIFRI
jgi:hypothetical protein